MRVVGTRICTALLCMWVRGGCGLNLLGAGRVRVVLGAGRVRVEKLFVQVTEC